MCSKYFWKEASRYNKLTFHYGHIRWLLLVITGLTSCWQRKYISLLMTKVPISFGRRFPLPKYIIVRDADFYIKRILFSFLTIWLALNVLQFFYARSHKTNEQKLMNVHVQIKCYIIFLSFSLPKLLSEVPRYCSNSIHFVIRII